MMDVGRKGDKCRTKQRWTLNGIATDIKWIGEKRQIELQWMSNGMATERNEMDDNCAVERSAFVSSMMMVCKREEGNVFLLLRVFFLVLFFFFQSCYKGYSLHDYKLKNTQECTTQMLTSKPMYKENKFWSSSFLPPSKAPKLKTSQLVVYFRCPFSLAYVAISYDCCLVIAIVQEYKKKKK